MEQPLVSVIIPTYSRPDNIVRAIDSVLAQTYKNIEIIVVDDNGERTPHQIETEKVLAGYINQGKIIYLKNMPCKNLSAARNTGFKASHGEYVNFLEDDCEMLPLCIEKHLEKFSIASDGIGATYCCSITNKNNSDDFIVEQINQISKSVEEKCYIYDCLMSFPKAFFATSVFLFRRHVISELNGWNENYSCHQDLELLARFFRKYEIALTCISPLCIFNWNKGRSNLSKSQKDYDIMEKSLADFADDLRKWGFYNDVMHHVLFSCAASALYASDYKIFRKAYASGVEFKKLTISEKECLLKCFVAGKANGLNCLEMKKYTIIIPHYNIPNLLQRCLFTIPQRDDLNVIVIDDHTPDAFELLLKCPDLYRNDVHFVHREKSGGGGAARNDGLRLSKSEWILFADADDYFNPCLNDVLNDYSDSPYDLVVFNATSVDSNSYLLANRALFLNKYLDQWDKKKEEVANVLKFRLASPWCKLIRRSIVTDNNIWFDEIPKNNDYHFSYQMGAKVKSITIDKRALYCVTYRSDSITFTKESPDAFLLRIKLHAECSRYFKDNEIPAEENAHFCLLLQKRKDKDLFNKGIEILHCYGFTDDEIRRGFINAFFINIKNNLRNIIRYRIRKV